MMRSTTVIIGAGQAGLAMSHCLSEVGIDHVVLERGKVAERWRSQSWDSLRLLTPNWMTRLPGFHYDGHDPDDFMSVPDLVALLERYAEIERGHLESLAAGLWAVDEERVRVAFAAIGFSLYVWSSGRVASAHPEEARSSEAAPPPETAAASAQPVATTLDGEAWCPDDRELGRVGALAVADEAAEGVQSSGRFCAQSWTGPSTLARTHDTSDHVDSHAPP